MATAVFEAYFGTPAWGGVGANRLVLSGVGGLATKIDVNSHQDESHLGSGTPGTDQCGVTHVPNVKFLTTGTMDKGSGSQAINDTNLAETDCTCRVHVNDAGTVTIASARGYVFDNITPTTEAADILAYMFERGVSATAWTKVNDTGGFGGDNTGERIDLGDKGTPATDHFYYLAVSMAPLALGAKSALALGWAGVVS
jgi:hypothetical protein